MERLSLARLLLLLIGAGGDFGHLLTRKKGEKKWQEEKDGLQPSGTPVRADGSRMEREGERVRE